MTKLQARQLGFNTWSNQQDKDSLNNALALLGDDKTVIKAFWNGWDAAKLGDFC